MRSRSPGCRSALSWAQLAVVDITSETSPTLVASWRSGEGGGSQDWNSTVGGAGNTTNAAWFSYHNANDPCSTQFLVTTSSDLFRSTNGISGAVVSSGFPVVRSARSSGMSDYLAAIRDGLVTGDAFGTWAEPEVTSASCIGCMGSQYSLRIRGVKVSP